MYRLKLLQRLVNKLKPRGNNITAIEKITAAKGIKILTGLKVLMLAGACNASGVYSV